MPPLHHFINADWDSQPMWASPYRNGYWGDSRVQANDVILASWQQGMKQPAWLQAGPDLFEQPGVKE